MKSDVKRKKHGAISEIWGDNKLMSCIATFVVSIQLFCLAVRFGYSENTRLVEYKPGVIIDLQGHYTLLVLGILKSIKNIRFLVGYQPNIII